jgi:HK97 family phage portal protein
VSLRSRVASWLLAERKAPADGRLLTGLVGPQTPNVPVYSPMTVAKATRQGYRISIYVYRSVRAIVHPGSAIPWMVTDRNGAEVEGHPFIRMLQHPNDAMSGQDLMELLMSHMLLSGNALWQPLIVGGQWREIWPVMPDLVSPVPSDKLGEWLRCWLVRDSQGGQREVAPETFIHFMQLDPGNPYWGTSPLMTAARTVDTDNEAQDTQKITMQNRGLTDGVFEAPGDLTPEQFEQARLQLREQYTAKLDRRTPWIIGGGAKYHQMSLTAVEMDFIASRLANKQDIAAAFGIDSAFLGDKSASTYNNVIEMKRALYENAVLPMLDDIKATLNARVPLAPGETITYDTSGVAALRDDYAKKVDAAGRLWALGVPMQQLNEVLELGLQEYPGWDVSYLPFSVMAQGGPITELTVTEEETQPEAAAKGLRKSLNVNTEEQKAAHWKRVDLRRSAYWNVVAKRLAPLYGAGADAVVRAVRHAQNEGAKNEATAAIESLRPRWEKTLTAICLSLVEAFGNDTARDLGGQPKGQPGSTATKADGTWVFDPFTESVQAWLAQHVTKSTTLILRSEADRVSRLIEKGFSDNDTIDEIARSIRDYYDGPQTKYNAMRTARTEIGSAAGYGQREAARQSGVVLRKTWVAARDDRVRDSHQEIDGQTRGLDDEYSNGLMFPGDPSGDPSEFVSCRCVESYS